MEEKDKIEKLTEIFKLLASIELGAARIYRIFYDRFRESEAGAFWYQTAIEEDEHAIYFDHNAKLAQIMPDAFGEPKVTPEELNGIIEALKKLEQEAASYKTDLRRAIEIARTIEVTVKEAEFVKLLDIRAESLKRKFDFIVSETEKHMESIDKLSKELGFE